MSSFPSVTPAREPSVRRRPFSPEAIENRMLPLYFRWDDLCQVTIVTTDEGPLICDVYWYLVGTESECVIPQGATGDDVLMEALGRLPGFDDQQVCEAMACADNREFICWKK